MSRLDPKWRKEVEDFFNNMTDDEFGSFLDDSGYEVYKNVDTPVLSNPQAAAEEIFGPLIAATCEVPTLNDDAPPENETELK